MKKHKDTALTHLNSDGHVHMVDVGAKTPTHRRAVAQSEVRMTAATKRILFSGAAAKGDVMASARLAGIMAAKKTGDLIPLCHPLPLTYVSIDIRKSSAGVKIKAVAETVGLTGVEMEAMTAASVAALTIYDMLKAVEKGMRIEGVELLEKKGGKSGHWRRSKMLKKSTSKK